MHVETRVNFMQSICYYCLILNKTGLCPHLLVELPNIRLHKNLVSSSKVTCAHTNS
jgi:hypothetical protein